MRLAINGFGRIGRTVLRQILPRPHWADVEVALVNDIAPLDMLAYLFRYDSTFGPWPDAVSGAAGTLTIGDRAIPVSHSPDLARIDLSGVDVLMDCTGIARTSDVAARCRWCRRPAAPPT